MVALHNKLPIIITLMLAMFITSCAKQISSDTYSGGHVGEVSETLEGVVVSAMNVRVQDKDYLEQNGLGLTGGALAGAVAGSAAGKGNGLATVAGALVGATAGAFAEKALKEQNARQYIVKISNGKIVTVVQGTNNPLHKGQRVYVLMGDGGNRARVIPR
jgi:outer membrane lipoprotein SlyB